MNKQLIKTQEIEVSRLQFGRFGDKDAGFILMDFWSTRDVTTGEVSFYAKLPHAGRYLTSVRNFAVVVLCCAWGLSSLVSRSRLWRDADTCIDTHWFITGALEQWQHLRGWNPEDPEYDVI
jgi:hypothetical protein